MIICHAARAVFTIKPVPTIETKKMRGSERHQPRPCACCPEAKKMVGANAVKLNK